MNNKEVNILVNTFSDVKSNSPILLVGGAMILFKKMTDKYIYKLTNSKEVRDFINRFSGIEYDRPVIVEDIGALNEQSSFLLLKLVEDAKFPIILLSYTDNISEILLSRIKTYIKFPVDNKTSCAFVPISEAQESVYDERGNLSVDESTLESYCAENCPELYLLHRKTLHLRNRKKYFELLKED